MGNRQDRWRRLQDAWDAQRLWLDLLTGLPRRYSALWNTGISPHWPADPSELLPQGPTLRATAATSLTTDASTASAPMSGWRSR